MAAVSNLAVLVVDDDPSVGATMSRLVQAAGYEPIYVNSALAALSRLETGLPRIVAVLTDLHMASMDGLGLAQRISQQHPNLPVVLCSGDSGPGVDSLEHQAGVTAVLSKPVRLQRLVDLLSVLVKQ